MKRMYNPALKITEEQFLQQVIDLAHIYHWKVAHFRPAMTSKGWRTAVGADGEGYPDLTLARGRDGKRSILFIELKSEKGVLSPDQREWLDLLGGFVFRPSDWEAVDKMLR